MNALRSIIFNIIFYGIWTPIVCICTAPALLMPRSYALKVATMYQRGSHFLEKHIMNLDYEIRGEQYKPPADQACLIACKHQSAYETMRLYMLFGDPAIILKRELLSLPIFGAFLKKLEVIAIDRQNRAEAMNSLYLGGHKVKDQNRPIVIFPQGTRVAVDATTREKPYKTGIGKLYVELNLPVYPVALNTGVYWPRNAFWKKSGTVVFEFLPPIESGLPLADVMKQIEDAIEPASKKLVTEAREQ